MSVCLLSAVSIAVILLNGDISTNPGPIQYPCGVCDQQIGLRDSALLCDNYNVRVHVKCDGIKPSEYKFKKKALMGVLELQNATTKTLVKRSNISLKISPSISPNIFTRRSKKDWVEIRAEG